MPAVRKNVTDWAAFREVTADANSQGVSGTANL